MLRWMSSDRVVRSETRGFAYVTRGGMMEVAYNNITVQGLTPFSIAQGHFSATQSRGNERVKRHSIKQETRSRNTT
jgi:hypothetical protein